MGFCHLFTELTWLGACTPFGTLYLPVHTAKYCHFCPTEYPLTLLLMFINVLLAGNKHLWLFYSIWLGVNLGYLLWNILAGFWDVDFRFWFDFVESVEMVFGGG